MPQVYQLKTFVDDNGNLTVFENVMPGTIQRVFYIYGAGENPRAGHRHRQSWNALVCLNGRCRIYCHNGEKEAVYHLDDPRECLVLAPEDWHSIDDFSEDAILLVVSNRLYSKDDYIYDPYPNSRWLGESLLTDS